MSSAILNITFDCADSGTIARFWSAVTGWPLHEEDLRPGHQEYSVGPSAEDGIRLYFAGVPEPKIVKNRIHLDLIPRGDQQQEIARLELFQSKVSFRRVAGPGCGLLRRRRADRPDLPGMPGICPEAGDMFTVSGVIAPEIVDIYERRSLWTGPAGARGTSSGKEPPQTGQPPVLCAPQARHAANSVYFGTITCGV